MKMSNGRILKRQPNGRFRKTTLQDFGISEKEMASGKMTCANCKHEWFPILKSGYCPQCRSQEKI